MAKYLTQEEIELFIKAIEVPYPRAYPFLSNSKCSKTPYFTVEDWMFDDEWCMQNHTERESAERNINFFLFVLAAEGEL